MENCELVMCAAQKALTLTLSTTYWSSLACSLASSITALEHRTGDRWDFDVATRTQQCSGKSFGTLKPCSSDSKHMFWADFWVTLWANSHMDRSYDEYSIASSPWCRSRMKLGMKTPLLGTDPLHRPLGRPSTPIRRPYTQSLDPLYADPIRRPSTLYVGNTWCQASIPIRRPSTPYTSNPIRNPIPPLYAPLDPLYATPARAQCVPRSYVERTDIYSVYQTWEWLRHRA